MVDELDEVEPALSQAGERGRSPIGRVRERSEDSDWGPFIMNQAGLEVSAEQARREFCNDLKDAIQGRTQTERMRKLNAASGLQTGTGPDGGFALPVHMQREIWNTAQYDDQALMPLTQEWPITEGDTMDVPALVTDTRTGGLGGGLLAYWKAEAAQLTASKPQLRNIELKLNELFVFTYATNKQLRSAPAIERLLMDLAPRAIRHKLNDSIVNGDGVGKPKGITKAAALVTVAKEDSQTAATINSANIAKMFARMPASLLSRAVWLMNQECFSQLPLLTIGDQPVYLPSGSLANQSPHGTLLGRPVIPCEHCAALGTVNDIILWAPQATGALRRASGVEFASSMHLRFDYAETAFRWLFEADAQPLLEKVITPAKGATQSGYIVLTTRS